MKKRKIRKKKQWNENRKRWISLNFLGSYLLILLAPAVAVLAICCVAKDAMVETQKEWIQSAVTEAETVLTGRRSGRMLLIMWKENGFELSDESAADRQEQEFYSVYHCCELSQL